MKTFTREFQVQWRDIDANQHMANTAYSEFMTSTRFELLRFHGIGRDFFATQGIGPAILKETIYYMREISLGDAIVVDVKLAGLSEDLKYFKFVQRIFRDEELCAIGEVFGVWMDLRKRKSIPCPDELQELFQKHLTGESLQTLTKEDFRYS